MKKILSLLLVLSLILSFAACGNEKVIDVKLSYNDNTEGAKTIGIEFSYPEEAGIEAEIDTDYAELVDEEEGYALKIALYEDEDYKTKDEWAKEMEVSYKEVDLLGYKGHSYNDVGGFTMFLLLETAGENFRYVKFDLDGDFYDEEAENFFYDNKEIQKVVNSFKYLGEIEDVAE